MTIEEARVWLAANKNRFDKFDNVDDMPDDIKESRLLGPNSELSWRRLLKEVGNGDVVEDDDEGTDRPKDR